MFWGNVQRLRGFSPACSRCRNSLCRNHFVNQPDYPAHFIFENFDMKEFAAKSETRPYSNAPRGAEPPNKTHPQPPPGLCCRDSSDPGTHGVQRSQRLQAASSVREGEGPAPACSVHGARNTRTPAVYRQDEANTSVCKPSPGAPSRRQPQ